MAESSFDVPMGGSFGGAFEKRLQQQQTLPSTPALPSGPPYAQGYPSAPPALQPLGHTVSSAHSATAPLLSHGGARAVLRRYSPPQEEGGRNLVYLDAMSAAAIVGGTCSLVVMLLTASLYITSLYGDTVQIHGTQQVLVPASSWFFRSVSLTLYGAGVNPVKGDATHVKGTAGIRVLAFDQDLVPKSSRQLALVDGGGVVPSRQLRAWSVFLMGGSSVRVEFAVPPESRLDLALIRGVEAYEMWKNDPSANNTGVLMRNTASGRGHFFVKAAVSEWYFFVAGNYGGSDVRSSLTVLVNKFDYDTSKASWSCGLVTSADPCVVPMPLDQGRSIILDGKYEDFAYSFTQEVKVNYEGRLLGYYLLAFTPVVLTLATFFFLQLASADIRSGRRDRAYE